MVSCMTPTRNGTVTLLMLLSLGGPAGCARRRRASSLHRPWIFDQISGMGASVSGTYDVVVVGAGHNGLVAAAYVARAGMSVLVLERGERVGGAVASGEVTRPGFVHDLFATNQNLFLGSPAFAELGADLARHGLRFATTDRPYANVFPDGRSLRVYQDAHRTRDLLERHDAADAEGWDRLLELYERFAPVLFELYGTRMPSRGAVRRLVRAGRELHAGSRRRLPRDPGGKGTGGVLGDASRLRPRRRDGRRVPVPRGLYRHAERYVRGGGGRVEAARGAGRDGAGGRRRGAHVFAGAPGDGRQG